MERIELVKEENLVIKLTVISLVIAAIMIVVGIIITPFSVRLSIGSIPLPVSLIMYLLAFFALIVIHELIHGFFIKKYSGTKVIYGVGFAYAYAGSKAYFNMRQYIIISLAPVIVLGAFFLALSIALPLEWFWTIYIFQIINITSAAGDFYMAYYIRRQPKDVLVQDDGPAMSIFHKT